MADYGADVDGFCVGVPSVVDRGEIEYAVVLIAVLPVATYPPLICK